MDVQLYHYIYLKKKKKDIEEIADFKERGNCIMIYKYYGPPGTGKTYKTN